MNKTSNPVIFIIEDSIIYKDLILGKLRSRFQNIQTFRNIDECIGAINQNPDVIILDYSVDGLSGLDFMKKYKEKHPQIDFIFLSAQNDVEVAVKIMKMGAADYIVKNQNAPERLEKAIELAIIHTKRQKMKQGFTIGVFGFFGLLLLVIATITAIILFFNL